jgi:hypothetical protein
MNQRFIAPIAGYYKVKGSCTTMVPTGKFETINNPDRKWWQLWKPRIITNEIMKKKEGAPFDQIVYLQRWEEIDIELIGRIK